MLHMLLWFSPKDRTHLTEVLSLETQLQMEFVLNKRLVSIFQAVLGYVIKKYYILQYNRLQIHKHIFQQPSDYAREFLNNDNPLTDTDFCPKEVLKFSPIPTSKYCKRSNFENFTSITKYDMDLKFNNVSGLYFGNFFILRNSNF